VLFTPDIRRFISTRVRAICAVTILSSASLAGQTPPAQAVSPAPAPASPKIEPVKTTVTVTGTRTATDLDSSPVSTSLVTREEPVSTSLVTREEMETRNIDQVDQALSLVEGVSAYRNKGFNDADFGVGMRGFSGRATGQTRTLVLLDGQPLNDPYTGAVNWAMLPVSEFERVEVARGPFSSLYGGNAMGGVINLITRRVDYRQVEILGQYGAQDTSNYSLHFTDHFFQKLGVSFGYQRYQSGGYQDQSVLKTATSGAGAVPVTGVLTLPTSTGGINYQVGRYGRDWFNQKAYRGHLDTHFRRNSLPVCSTFTRAAGPATMPIRRISATPRAFPWTRVW
jgi:iron complex outermembrane receptor protein